MGCHPVKSVSCRHLQSDLPWLRENISLMSVIPWEMSHGLWCQSAWPGVLLPWQIVPCDLGSNLPLLTYHHLKEWLRARILEINCLSSNPALQFHKSLWASTSSVSREDKSSNTSWDCMRNKWMYSCKALRTVSDTLRMHLLLSLLLLLLLLWPLPLPPRVSYLTEKQLRSQWNHQKARQYLDLNTPELILEYWQLIIRASGQIARGFQVASRSFARLAEDKLPPCKSQIHTTKMVK